MEKRHWNIFLASLLLIVIVSGFAIADGGYFPHPGYWVMPGQQKAVIFHENNVETMILTSGFIGNAKDLAWIIPTPTKPEVTKADEEVFTNAAKLAQARYYNDFSYGRFMASAKNEMQGGVVVIESKKVDYYDVNVIIATNSDELVKWFNENDYSYPESYSYILKSYIERGWYFTAIKVSPEAQGAMDVVQDMKEGHPTPVKMVFLSEKIVFPLKISAVEFPKKDEKKYGAAKDELIGAIRSDNNGYVWTKLSNITGGDNWHSGQYGISKAPDYSYPDYKIDTFPGGINYVDSNTYRYGNYIPIELFVFADGKYEAGNFYANYGNWVKKKDIEKLGDDERGEAYIKPKKDKYYLTRLTASMQKSQMDDDVYLRKADNNKKVNAGPEAWELFLFGIIWGIIAFMIWLCVPIWGILFIIGILLLFFSKSNGMKIFGWVLVIVSFVLTLIPGLILVIAALAYGSLGNYIVLSLIITWLIILAIMVVFGLLAAKYRGK